MILPGIESLSSPEDGSHWAVVSLGSNLLEGEAMVRSALESLNSVAPIVVSSTVYTTAPLSGHGRNYFNAVAIVNCGTTTSKDSLEQFCKEYELQNGRTPRARECGEVPVDLDVVIFGHECLRPSELTRAYFRQGFSECINTLGTPHIK